VPVPKEIAAKVEGGIPGTDDEWGMWGYALQEITPEGKVAWEWLSYEHLDPKLDSLTPLNPRTLWPLWNSVEELPDGNIMTCSPSTDVICIIDKSTGKVKWRWGKGIISYAHNPTMLDNGNVLVFDNGASSASPRHSRAVEVNPNTNEIEWEYQAENPVDFFSDYISGCQRLPNGNTLICEGSMGRIFEVTTKGELVWEYIVPFYDRHDIPGPGGVHIGYSNATYRAHRYGPDYPGLQGKRLDPVELDLWNRLYGPEAFSPQMRTWYPPMEGMASYQETLAKKEAECQAEEKPSAAKPGSKPAGNAEDKAKARLKRLGY
jgi:hypothetical protein